MPSHPIDAELLSGEALYRRVVLEKMAHARESVLIATANVKAMLVELQAGQFRPIADLFAQNPGAVPSDFVEASEGSVAAQQALDILEKAGVKGIFGPGTVILDAARQVLSAVRATQPTAAA